MLDLLIVIPAAVFLGLVIGTRFFPRYVVEERVVEVTDVDASVEAFRIGYEAGRSGARVLRKTERSVTFGKVVEGLPLVQFTLSYKTGVATRVEAPRWLKQEALPPLEEEMAHE